MLMKLLLLKKCTYFHETPVIILDKKEIESAVYELYFICMGHLYQSHQLFTKSHMDHDFHQTCWGSEYKIDKQILKISAHYLMWFLRNG